MAGNHFKNGDGERPAVPPRSNGTGNAGVPSGSSQNGAGNRTSPGETAMFAALQIARMTGDRARDLPDPVRAQVLEKMRSSGAPERWTAMVEQVVQMDADDQKRSLGDSLPPGLVLL